ncbi:MAG: hypothetical protein R2873_21520 [Caldilineaceae bacterium]
MRRGRRFLSDEIVALRQDDGVLAPFPRAVHLRAEPAPAQPPLVVTDAAETWIDIAHLFPDSLGEDVPAAAVCAGRA